MSKSISNGSGVTAPFTSSRPDFGIFIDAANDAGPATGQLTSLISADRSVTASVLTGLTASSLKVSPPLRSATCSTLSLKSGCGWPAPLGEGGEGAEAAKGAGGVAGLAVGAGPWGAGGPASAT